MELTYGSIQKQLVGALPEIGPAAERYWEIEGMPGQDCGPYIFFEDVFGTYVEALLAMEPSPKVEYLLKRAFEFTEEMLASEDLEVANLAYVGLYEWRAEWWYARAERFIGPRARAELDRYDPGWRQFAPGFVPTEKEKSSIIDLYGVRSVIASELVSEGVAPGDIPGTSHSR